jgi:hypothetical protein
MLKRLATLCVFALLTATAAQAQEGTTEPYKVSVWARVLFGPDGKAAEYALFEPAKYPTKFAENVLARVARASVPPPQVDGRPVTLRSGVELRFVITPAADGSATVRLDGVAMGPMPTKRYLASYPKDVGRTGGWEGDASAVCRIGIEGRCTGIEVSALPGMPDSVRRFMRASLERWEFEPQQLDGKPIEGEYKLAVRFNTYDNMPEDFREDKFLRLLRGR